MNSSAGAGPLSPVTMARWPEGRTTAGTRLEPSLSRMIRADRSPTPAMRPTSPRPSTAAEPSVDAVDAADVDHRRAAERAAGVGHHLAGDEGHAAG